MKKTEINTQDFVVIPSCEITGDIYVLNCNVFFKFSEDKLFSRQNLF